MHPTFDPLPIETRLGPYDVVAQSDRAETVRWHPLLLGWAITGHAETTRVLNDPSFASDRARASLPGLGPQGAPLAQAPAAVDDVFRRMLLFTDPPDHPRVRGLVGRAISPIAVGRYRPAITQLVEGILRGLDPGRDVDFMAQVARPVAAGVLAHVLGIGPDDRPDFDRWSDALEHAIDPRHSIEALARAEPVISEMERWLGNLVALRRRSPGDDVISFLATEGVDKGVITLSEVLATVALLGAVGRETVADLMGSAVLLLLRHPDQRAVLQERPSGLVPAIEESLRCESPAQVIARVATRAGDLGGEHLSPGDMVILLLGAANRDASRFRDPERFDVRRHPNRHLAFGAGPHRCPGASLGRAQARVALAGFLRQFPAFNGDPAASRWKPTVVHRGLSNLPLHL